MNRGHRGRTDSSFIVHRSSFIVHPSSAILHLFLIALLTAAAANAQSTIAIHGFLTARVAYVTGPPSWIEGGFGRLDVGAGGVDEHAYRGNAVAQLGADWNLSSWFTAHAQLLGRAQPASNR